MKVLPLGVHVRASIEEDPWSATDRLIETCRRRSLALRRDRARLRRSIQDLSFQRSRMARIRSGLRASRMRLSRMVADL